ncbi:MAG: hypothetical protein ACYCSO_08195 [Cuniculiplasma sp.]
MGNRRPKRHLESYDIFLVPEEIRESATVKLKKLNRKKIRTVAMVILVTTLFLGFYTAMGGSIVLNEVGIAASYFEPSPTVHYTTQFVYYLTAWWSPSHGNPQQSMVNAIYAAGLGFILQGVGYLIGVTLGYQPIAGQQLVAFVAGLLVGIYYAWSIYTIAASAANDAIAAGASASQVAELVGAYGLVGSLVSYLAVYMGVIGAL